MYMKNESNSLKRFIVVLNRNGEIIPQYGLEYNTYSQAEQIAGYLNELMPENLRKQQQYQIISK